MATPGTETGYVGTDLQTPAEGAHLGAAVTVADGAGIGRDMGTTRDWVTVASFIFGGITALGFLLIVIGEYLASSTATVLAGTTVICLGGIAWGLAAVILIYQLVRQRINSGAVAHK